MTASASTKRKSASTSAAAPLALPAAPEDAAAVNGANGAAESDGKKSRARKPSVAPAATKAVVKATKKATNGAAAAAAEAPAPPPTIDELLRRGRHLVMRGAQKALCDVVPTSDVPHQNFVWIATPEDRERWLSDDHRDNACPICISELVKVESVPEAAVVPVKEPAPTDAVAEDDPEASPIVPFASPVIDASILAMTASDAPIAPPHPIAWIAMFQNGTFALVVASNRDIAVEKLQGMGHAVDPDDIAPMEAGDALTFEFDPKFGDHDDRTPYIVPRLSQQLAARIGAHVELCSIVKGLDIQ
ncbi:MAG: hypothetical protein ACHREM_00490 [Polyangiales bacterium]